MADSQTLTASIDVLDIALGAVTGGSAGLWIDAGSHIYASNAPSAISILDAGLIGIGTSSPSYLLDVGGSLNTTSLWLAGSEVIASASELNILNGALLSTSELNLLNGATVTTNEINYLSGSGAVIGGLLFGDGDSYTQSATLLSWDTFTNRLGIGTSAPAYTLDVIGDIGISSSYDLHIGNIGLGDSASATTSGAYLVGVFDEFSYSDSTRLQDVLDDFDEQMSVLGGGSSKWTDLGSLTFLTDQANNLAVGGSTPASAGLFTWASTGSLSLDNYSFYYDGSSNRLGIGNSNPQYTLDIAGDIGISSGYDLHIGNIGLGDSASATTAGAYLVGVYPEFDNSTGTRLQDVLNDLDAAITTLGGSSPQWTDAGTYIFAANAPTAVGIEDTTGYLGLGTTNPAVQLEVVGEARAQRYAFQDNTGVYLDTVDTNELVFYTNSTERMMIDASGQVGIGTTAPSALTHISSTAAQNLFRVDDNGVGDSTPFLINQDGNVGIGTTNPLTALDLVGNLTMHDDYWVGLGASAGRITFNDTTTDELQINDALVGIGLGTSTPQATLHILDTTEQLRLAYDATNYMSFTIDATGQLTLSDSGTQVARFDAGGIDFDVPANFNAAGDVSIANDLVMTNSTTSYITYEGPGYIRTYHPSNSYDLTLSAANSGQVIIADTMKLYSADPSIIFDTITSTDTDFWMGVLEDAGNDDDDIFVIGDGLTPGTNNFLAINTSGYVGIGTTNPQYELDVVGDIGITSGYDLHIGNIGLGDSASATTAGAYLVGVYPEFDNSSSTRVQSVLNDIDAAIANRQYTQNNYVADSQTLTASIDALDIALGSVSGGSAGLWRDAGAYTYLNAASQTVGILDTTGYLGLGTTNPSVQLEVVGETRATRFAFQDDTNTYIDTVDADELAFVTSGNYKMIIDASGNVGIGTTNPGQELDVIGDISLSNYLYFDNATTEYLRWDGSDFILSDDLLPSADDSLDIGSTDLRWRDLFLGPGSIHIGSSTADEYVLSYDTLNNRLGFNFANTGNPEMVIDSSGRVGIGTTAPANLLELAAPSGDSSLTFDTGGSDRFTMGVDASDGNKFKIEYGSSLGGGFPVFAVDANYIGIGTSSPQQVLHIHESSTGRSRAVFTNQGSGLGSDDGFEIGIYGATPEAYVWNNENTSINFGTNDTSRLIISGGGNFNFNTNQLVVQQSSGNIGISTTNPLEKLHLAGSDPRIFLSDSSAPGTTANRLYSISGNLYWNGSQLSTGGSSLWTDTGTYIYANNAPTTAAILDTTGYMGLGTTNPAVQLEVVGEARATRLAFQDDTDTYIDTVDANELAFVTGNNYRMLIDASGQVGIGTTNPSSRLEVVGETRATRFAFQDDPDTYIDTVNANELVFTTGGTERVFIDASGYVGLGTTTPTSALDIVGNITMYDDYWIGLGDTGAGRITFNDTTTDEIQINDALVGIGLGTSTPQASLHILDNAEQLRLAYDADNYMSFTIDATGQLTLADSGTQVARFDAVGIDFDVPVNFNASGDVSIAYDLVFTNQTASKIESYGPFTIEAGESSENNNLTLRTYGTGDIIFDLTGTGQAQLMGTDTSILFNTTTSTDTDFWMGILDDAGNDDDDIFAIGDGLAPGSNIFLSIDTSGQVGIGTTAPSYTLDVVGDIGISSGYDLHIGNIGLGDSASATTSGAYLVGVYPEFDNSTGTRLQDVLNDLDAAITTLGGSSPQWTDAGTYIFAANAPTAVGIEDTTGYLGLGTTNPAVQLEVVGEARAQRYAFQDNTGVYLDTVDTNELVFYTNSSERMMIDASGQVGIGTTAPSTALDLVGNLTMHDNYWIGLGASGGRITFDDQTTDYINFSDAFVGIGYTAPAATLHVVDTTEQLRLGYDASNYMSFTIDATGQLTLSDSGTQVARFDAGGIDFDVPASFNANGDVTIAYDLTFTNATSSYIKSEAPLYIVSGENYNNDDLTLRTYGTGDIVFDLSGTGQVHLLGTDTSLFFDTRTSSDTDFWMGILDDAGNDDDDIFVIGDGLTPGTNNFLTINTSGYVGIGTTAPGQLLDVAGNIELNNYLYFGNASSEYLRWDSSDFILSDDLLPNADDSLDIGSTDFRWRDLFLGPGSIHIGSSAADEYVMSYDTLNNRLGFNFTNTGNPEITITSSGNLGIGTTSPSEALDVLGSAEISGTIGLGGTAANADRYLHLDVTNSDNYSVGSYMRIVQDAAVGGGGYAAAARNRVDYNNSGTYVGELYAASNRVDNSGTGTINGTTYGTFGATYNTSSGDILTGYGTHGTVQNSSSGGYTSGAIGAYGGVSNTGSGVNANSYGVYGRAIDQGTAYSVRSIGVYGASDFSSTSASGGDFTGGYFFSGISTAGTVQNMYGVESDLTTSGGAIIGNQMMGVRILPNLGISTIPSLYGFYLGDDSGSSPAVVDKAYGLYLGDYFDMATNPYAIFSNSASDSYLKGSLGIGTSAPNSAVKLHVAGKGLFEDQVEIYNNKSLLIGNLSLSENSLFLGADDSDIEADGYLTFSPNNTEIMRLTMAGSVGIGATSPLGKLHVKTSEVSGGSVSSVADDFVLEVNGDGGLTIITPNTSTGTLGFGNDNDSLEAWLSYDASSYYMDFGVEGDYAMRLFSDELAFGQEHTISTASGDLHVSPADNLLIWSNVGIGVTATTNALQVSGNIRGSTLRSDAAVYINYDGPDGDGYLAFYDGGDIAGKYIMWNNSTDQFEINDTVWASDFTCSDCLGSGDIGTNAIGLSEMADSSVGLNELRTATTSTAGSSQANVTMHDYNFFPNFEVDDCGTPYNGGYKLFTTDVTNNTVGRIYVDASCTGGSWDVRWRYITSSDRPTIWVITNADGTIANAWESEDPIVPGNYPDNPNPFEGNNLKDGQRSISVEPLTITQVKDVFAQLPTNDRNNILTKLRTYIVSERQWLTSMSTIDDLVLIAERYRPSSRQWAMRFLADYYKISTAEFISEFTIVRNNGLVVVPNFSSELTTHLAQRTVTIAENKAKAAALAALPADQQGADLAEMYSFQPGAKTPEPGDLVSFGTPDQEGFVALSPVEYDQRLMGVISTDPGILLGRSTSESDIKVALSGRVPAKVSTQNGPIQKGDPLTSSSIPGVAMKATRAGRIVGFALENFNNPDPTAVGNVLVFINPTWNDPGVFISDKGNLALSGNDLEGFDVLNNEELVEKVGAYSDLIVANLEVGAINVQSLSAQSMDALSVNAQSLTLNGVDIGLLLTTNTEQNENALASIQELNLQIEDIEAYLDTVNIEETLTTLESVSTELSELQGEVLSLKDELNLLSAAVSQESTQSMDTNFLREEILAVLESLESTESTESTQSFDTEDATGILAEILNVFNEFKEFTQALGLTKHTDEEGNDMLRVESDTVFLGDVSLYNVDISGKLMAGLIEIDSLTNSINVLGSECYNEILGTKNDIICDAQTLYLQKNLTGNVNILNGVVVIEPDGRLTVDGTVEAEKIDINTTEVASASAGKVTIPAGETTIVVETLALTPDSLIFVTPETPVAIGSKKLDETTFEITIERVQGVDLEVSWWVIN